MAENNNIDTSFSGKKIRFAMLMLFIVALIFIIVINYLGPKKSNDIAHEELNWNEGWLLTDGEELKLPCVDKANDKITISKILPNELTDKDAIVISSGYQPLQVKVDGKDMPVIGTFEGRITYATAYSYVTLDSEMSGKEIEITFLNQGGKVWIEIYNIQLGNFNLIRQAAFTKDSGPVIFGTFLIAVAILIFILGLLQKESAIKVSNNITSNFGLAASVTFLFAIWMMVDTQTITLMFGGNPSYVFINIFSYLCIMGPWLMQVILTTGKNNAFLKVLSMFGYIETIAIVVGVIFGFFSFSLYLTISHSIGAFIEGAIIYLSFCQLKQRKDLASKLLFSASILLIIMSLISAYTYYFKVSPNNVSFMRYGIGGYIIVMLYDLFHTFRSINRQYVVEIEAARLAAEEANKAKSDFLSSMSHDIRTPMNAIMGLTTVASANIDNKEQVKDSLRKITLSSRHLLGLINDILDMSKIESGNISLTLTEISLSELVDNILNIVKPQINNRHQKFEIILENVTCENIYCDGVRLNQIFFNILSNAIKYTEEEGKIDVTIIQEPSIKGDKFISTKFIVKDTGIGMTKEFLKHIFDSFSRANNYSVHKTEGTGLGMYITKHIVDMMGGTIEVESEVGVGSTFTVTLDFEKVTKQEQSLILPPWNALVVDDDKQLCISAVDTLKEIGITAEWTQSGLNAIELVFERSKGLKPYNVVLIDWQMPDMNGIETAREIRKRVSENIPILLITAYDWTEIEAEAKEAGINGFLSKPLFQSTLKVGLMKYVLETEEDAKLITEEKTDFSGKRILLSEDNDLNWEIAKFILTSNGFIVDHAVDGIECFEMFEKSIPGYYDLILMDIRMPRMNGYESTKAIRALKRQDAKDVPILAMTADAFNEDIEHCLSVGMNAHISKPLDVKSLLKLLSTYIK